MFNIKYSNSVEDTPKQEHGAKTDAVSKIEPTGIAIVIVMVLTHV